MKKISQSLLAFTLLAGGTASAADYYVYNNGVLGNDLEYNHWWNASWNGEAADPAGSDAKVFQFNTTDGGANGSMGFMTTAGNGPKVMGPLRTATLHFDWYAEGTGNYTIRLAFNGDFDYSLPVTADKAGSWNTASFDVATQFPGLVEKINAAKADDVAFPFAIVAADASSGAKFYVKNVYYSNIDESYVAPAPVEIPAPATVPVPSLAAADVVSLMSGAYTAATTFGIGGWGQSTIYQPMTIDNAPVGLLKNFSFLGWELASHVDASSCTHMHVDYWTPDGTAFGFTPISPGPREKLWTAPEVKQNEWNSYDVPFTYFEGVDFTDLFQVKYDLGGGSCNGYIANVYFYKDSDTPVLPPSTDPKAKLVYNVVDGPSKAVLNYTINLENIDEEKVTAYRVWLDAPGNVMMGESTTKEGSIEVDVTGGNVTYWMKGQVTYTDGDGNSQTINTNPNDQPVDFKKVADPSVPVPVITITPGEPKALSATTGEIPFTLTTDKPELEGVSYRVWCETTGDKKLGEMTVTELNGTLALSDLNEGATTELWIKAQATVDGNTSEIAQYPGAAQGWTGLSINTSAFADPDKPIIPEFNLVAMNPLKTGDDTATLQYEVTLSNDKFFKSLAIKCVTNAFGGEVDVVLAEIPATTELSGTLNLSGLKPNAVNELWVKAVITITDDQQSAETTYPGAAQGWNGLSIDMTQSAIAVIEAEDEAPVEYFNLQGVRVENPAGGMFIRRQGSKVTKVVIR